MTKKMDAICKKMERKMEIEFWTFESGYSDFERTRERLRKIEKEFDELKTLMYFYDLISEKDFDATCGYSWEVYTKYFDKMIEIKSEQEELFNARQKMRGKKAV